MTQPGPTLRQRFGPWAVVTGAAEGLGAAFARALATEGLHLLLVDRKESLLQATAAALERELGVTVTPLAADLATRRGVEATTTAARSVEVGLLVCSAGLALVGPFLDQRRGDLEELLATNCRAPLLLCHSLGKEMAGRGRGGIVLVSSLSALQGTPLVAAYAASKAFDLVLGEGLWEELGRHGVTVLSVCLGPTRTPGWERSTPKATGRLSPRVMEPEEAVAEALAALGRGAPSAVIGRTNRAAGLAFGRLMPRRLAVRAMGRVMRALYGRPTALDLR